MHATLIVERIERRISIDMISDAEWLRTQTDIVDGELRIVDSMRYSDEDIAQYGAVQVQTWIAEDHRRYRRFVEGYWWFVDAQAVAVIGVHLDGERIGRVRCSSMIVGGIESDADRAYLDELTDILITEVREELIARGFTELDRIETPYVSSESSVAEAVS